MMETGRFFSTPSHIFLLTLFQTHKESKDGKAYFPLVTPIDIRNQLIFPYPPCPFHYARNFPLIFPENFRINLQKHLRGATGEFLPQIPLRDLRKGLFYNHLSASKKNIAIAFAIKEPNSSEPTALFSSRNNISHISPSGTHTPRNSFHNSSQLRSSAPHTCTWLFPSSFSSLLYMLFFLCAHTAEWGKCPLSLTPSHVSLLNLFQEYKENKEGKHNSSPIPLCPFQRNKNPLSLSRQFH